MVRNLRRRVCRRVRSLSARSSFIYSVSGDGEEGGPELMIYDVALRRRSFGEGDAMCCYLHTRLCVTPIWTVWMIWSGLALGPLVHKTKPTSLTHESRHAFYLGRGECN